MFDNFFDWIYDMTQKSTERVRKWRAMNQERKKEVDRKASKAYWDRMKDDPEFQERKREQRRRSAAKMYAEKKNSMTPEELEKRRRKNRERMAAARAAKKAAAAAAAAAESKP